MAHPEFVPLSEEEARIPAIQETGDEIETLPGSAAAVGGGGEPPSASDRQSPV